MNEKDKISEKVEKFIAPISWRIIDALPPDKTPDQYLAVVNEYLYRNPALFACERFSLIAAIVDAAFLGLELGAPFDLAEILPYKQKGAHPNEAPVHMAKLIIEYRGLLEQVYRTGRIKSVEARSVYKHDTFDYHFGNHGNLRHQPTLIGDRGPLIHAYAIAQLTDGGCVTEVINHHDADRARADSPGADKPGSIWRTRTSEMWQKTAIRKLVNRMPRESKKDVISLATAENNAANSDYKQVAENAVKLINAILISPEIFQRTLIDLKLEPPLDAIAIPDILARMRELYRAAMLNQPEDLPERMPEASTA